MIAANPALIPTSNPRPVVCFSVGFEEGQAEADAETEIKVEVKIDAGGDGKSRAGLEVMPDFTLTVETTVSNLLTAEPETPTVAAR